MLSENAQRFSRKRLWGPREVYWYLCEEAFLEGRTSGHSGVGLVQAGTHPCLLLVRSQGMWAGSLPVLGGEDCSIFCLLGVSRS